MCVRERVCVCVFVCERERERVCVCACASIQNLRCEFEELLWHNAMMGIKQVRLNAENTRVKVSSSL